MKRWYVRMKGRVCKDEREGMCKDEGGKEVVRMKGGGM